jgi:hypothetical protein
MILHANKTHWWRINVQRVFVFFHVESGFIPCHGLSIKIVNYTAPAQTCNHALVVGSWTCNSQPETSFCSWVTKKLQMPLAGFNLPVADACCGLKPTILVDCGLRFWSVRRSFFPLAGFSCGIAPACLQVFQLQVWLAPLRVEGCRMWLGFSWDWWILRDSQ